MGRVAVEDDDSPEGITVSIAGTNLITVTDGDGDFEIPGVPAGTATLSIRSPGYQTVRREGIVITGGQSLDIGVIQLVSAWNPTCRTRF